MKNNFLQVQSGYCFERLKCSENNKALAKILFN